MFDATRILLPMRILDAIPFHTFASTLAKSTAVYNYVHKKEWLLTAPPIRATFEEFVLWPAKKGSVSYEQQILVDIHNGKTWSMSVESTLSWPLASIRESIVIRKVYIEYDVRMDTVKEAPVKWDIMHLKERHWKGHLPLLHDARAPEALKTAWVDVQKELL